MCCGSVVAVCCGSVVPVCRVLQAALCRCSQPLAGFSARCVEDEQMLQAIRRANPTSKFMFVIDTRPKVSDADMPRQCREGEEEKAHWLMCIALWELHCIVGTALHCWKYTALWELQRSQ